MIWRDAVDARSATILQLLAGEDEPLLIWREALLVLDLLLHSFDGVGGLNIERDCLAGEGLDDDLHSAAKPKHKVEGRFLRDVVVTQSATILQLLAGEDEPLLIGRNADLRQDT